jgi:hypothetical protein
MPAPIIREVEAWLESEKTAIENALEAEWTSLKPQVLNLGQTILGQVWQAASTYVSTGGNYADALASIVAQVPADIAAAEHIIATALSGAVQSLTTATPATPPAA